MSTRTLCGGTISSRRGLLASVWSLVIILSGIAFLTTFIFALTARGGSSKNSYNYYNEEEEEQGSQDQQNYAEPVVAVTSRALTFAALWTAVLSALMSVFGTVILGWQSPTGMYYTCCSRSVHRTTPLGLGSFIGALLMFANLTLICSILFGEFEIRDYRDVEGRNGNGNGNGYAATEDRISMAFSIMCMFLTVMYAGFAALTFVFAHAIIEECTMDEREESMLSTRSKQPGHFHGFNGYIGERFDVGRSRGGTGFVAPPPPPEPTLA